MLSRLPFVTTGIPYIQLRTNGEYQGPEVVSTKYRVRDSHYPSTALPRKYTEENLKLRI
jgi:hypothetical protein